ncbi:hypothetical protein HQ865_04340 [Mucilaginibacter mali]|uniref:mannosyl-glycoprotein endo-beta-N-acetylglucosaminidase n=1 Tax=Mucilaginibacter mali TaxID=2740462 RepID=A0A7D4TKU3_9SPHI|nr:glycoside hydrolase family 18 [Mucilaginibacter mali]QKJ29013.1 hypothetical protein HQ865_04340 [Mucilaginibacter mali]
MKFYQFLALCLLVIVAGCVKQTTPQAVDIQKPFTYSDQYYQNLRDYKKSDHEITYGWFADYSQTFSIGYHFIGLPDSLDICSLWGGIPSLRKNDPKDSVTSYNPVAYNEMIQVRTQKGVKMVVPVITRMQALKWTKLTDDGIKAYGDYLMGMVFDNDLDGLDCDYEPEGDWLQGDNFVKLIQYIGQSLGPKSKNPQKLLIVDFYSQAPPAAVEPYVNYFVRQSYNATSDATLQSQYNTVAAYCPTKKFIVTENIGDNWQNGGVAFTQANGNNKTKAGTQLYSLEGMARWEPATGRKGGWGGFYMQRDYNLDPPYKNFRRCIQIVNPSVK